MSQSTQEQRSPWFYAAIGSAMLGLQSTFILQAFGSYAVILQERFGWSKTSISLAYSLKQLESGLLGPLQGWAIQRFGSTAVMRTGAALLLVGFTWFSQIQTVTGFVLSFLVISIGAGLSGFMTITNEIVRRFTEHRSKALSIVGFGVAIGGVFSPVVVYTMVSLGWRLTAFGSGLLISLLTFLLAATFKDRTPNHLASMHSRTDTTSDYVQSQPDRESSDLTAREALRHPAFWLIASGHAIALTSVGTALVHLPSHLTQDRELTLGNASFVVAAITVTQVVGMTLGGYLGDRYPKKWLCSIAMIGHALGMLALLIPDSRTAIGLVIALHGLAWGLRGPLMSGIRADFFGTRSFAQIMGLTSVILMFGSVGGPLVTGYLYDISGSYSPSFASIGSLCIVGSLLFALAQPPQKSPVVISAC